MYNQGGGILEEFKNVYNRGNNAHVQLILINLVIFLVLIISNVFLDLLMGTKAFEFVLTQLAMPSNINNFISLSSPGRWLLICLSISDFFTFSLTCSFCTGLENLSRSILDQQKLFRCI